MSACFQKQVGKRKKTEDENDLDLTSVANKADETVISDDSNGSGRSDRLTKRRKREVELDDKFEYAKEFLQKEFGIEVDDSMSRREVIELAASCLSSKNDQPETKKLSQSSDSDKLVHEVESSEDEIVENVKQGKHQRRKNEDGWLNSNVKQAANKSQVDAKGDNQKERKVAVTVDSSSSESKDESEDPLPSKEIQDKTRASRKRMMEESVTDENSSQEYKDVRRDVRTKKSRNLQLNRRQIASMQAKTSSLLKKSAANVKLSQDNQPSPEQNMADEETQDPGSQELFVEDTKTKEAEPKSGDESDYCFKPRNRTVTKGAITADKFMDVLWPQHVPMKRTQFPKTIAIKKTRKKDQVHTFYTPPGKDPISYSKVILQLFNIYFKKLSREQSKMPSLKWNDPVKAGRHMSRTIDVKGRGQDSYPWSSDNEAHSEKSSDDEKGASLKVNSRRQTLTKTGRFLRNNSNDSNRDSENDFIPEPTRIQPRRAVVTPRKALREVVDDEDLPDFGISSSDNPPEAGQTYYEGETQPMSPVFQSAIPQTLGMDEDIYMADTENVCPVGMEVQSDESSNPKEIQPRKVIHKNPVVEDDPIDGDEVRSKGRSPKVRSSRKVRNGSASPRPSQGSSGSILNSQGELNSFQKVKPASFNLDLDDDEDSKDLDIQNLLKKDVPVSKNNPVELSSSDDETSAVDSVHESPVLSTRKSRSTFTKGKAKNIAQDISGDDIFEGTKKKKAFTIFNSVPDSDEDQKPSTSKNRVIPIILVDTYEKRPRATASVKPIPKNKPKPIDDSEEIPQSKVQKKQEKVECPMCSKMFDADKILIHASDCLGQHEVTSTTGDDEVPGVPDRLRPGPSGENVNQRRGGNSVQTKLIPVDTLIGDPRREVQKQPVKQDETELEQCCVCGELVPGSEIETHTDRCISARMEASRHETLTEPERPEPRATRAARREYQAVFYDQQPRDVEKLEIESISSDDSVKDPEWNGEEEASSANDPESPLKFKKISQLATSDLDFQNQFKSKGTKTYTRTAKRGANSRGRGKKGI